MLRIFTDTVTSWYRRRHRARGLPDGETGAVTAIQRANSDWRLSPHFHTLCLDGICNGGLPLRFAYARANLGKSNRSVLLERVAGRELPLHEREAEGRVGAAA